MPVHSELRQPRIELVVGDREQQVGAGAHSVSPPGAMSSVPARSRASCSRALIE